VNEQIEVTKVYEDDFVVAVMDIQPINSGHLFISPKKQKKRGFAGESHSSILKHVQMLKAKISTGK